jgi:hypothetical protein
VLAEEHEWPMPLMKHGVNAHTECVTLDDEAPVEVRKLEYRCHH